MDFDNLCQKQGSIIEKPANCLFFLATIPLNNLRMNHFGSELGLKWGRKRFNFFFYNFVKNEGEIEASPPPIF